MRLIFPCVLMVASAACSPPSQKPASPPAASVAAVSMLASVSTPAAGSQSRSPLDVSGIAPNNWFFEASFPVTLVDANNRTIAEAPAQAQSDWTVQGPVMFKAQLNFLVLQETPATLVLREDMPGENNPAPREVRIPVVLEPGG